MLTAKIGKDRDRPVRPVWPVVIRVGLDFLIHDLCKLTHEGVRLPRPINMKAKAD
jgi:hypothetical protein